MEENRRHRNNVVAIRKKSIAKYFESKCTKKDKSFWSTVSPFFTDKHVRNNNGIVLNEGNDTIVDSQKVSDILFDYFANIALSIGFDDEIVATDEAIATHRTHPSVHKIRENHGELAESFSFHCINPETVLVKLKCINSKKATGFDNIPGKLIRLAHRELASPLSKLINGCILSNSFPGIMKCAELSPVYKKQDKLQKGNYRPVSILTCISKIYESVLNDQLLEYFNVIFNDFISAFRKGHICQSL